MIGSRSDVAHLRRSGLHGAGIKRGDRSESAASVSLLDDSTNAHPVPGHDEQLV